MIQDHKSPLLLAGLATLLGAALGAGARAQTPTSVTLSDVYSTVLSNTVSNAAAPNGTDNLRGLAVNNNAGSPWKGTLYITRRAVASPAATAAVFYWKAAATNPAAAAGSGTLKPAGPDFAHPDGVFDNNAIKTAGFDPASGNSFWGIGVAGDDYVYVTGLTAGKVVRTNPDGSNPVVVVATGFTRQRAIWVTGKGMDTRIWLAKDNAPSATTVERWKPTATAPDGGPTTFVPEQYFTSSPPSVVEPSAYTFQIVPNTDRSAVYYGRGFTNRTDGGGPWPPAKRNPAGVLDTAFTDPLQTANIMHTTGVAMDSQDRVLFLLMPDAIVDWGIAAVDPVTGANLTANSSASGSYSFFTPSSASAGSAGMDYNNFGELARYSNHHYFYLYNQAVSTTTTGGALVGVFATNVPAAAPTNVTVVNGATVGSLQVSWTLNGPETLGADIYRSQTAGTLGTRVNSAPVAGNSYTDPGLTLGATYYYTVRAVSQDPFTGSTYTSTNTDQVAGTVSVPAVPAAPTDQSATDKGDGSGILLAWTNPPSDAATIRVYRSTQAGALGSLVHTDTTVTASASETWLDADVQMGQTYFYTIKAANAADQESTNTNQLTATATDTVLPTFAGVTEIRDVGGPGLRLLWTSAQDNSAPVTYNIYVSTTPDGFDFSKPFATTQTTGGVYDLGGLVMRRGYYIVVRAKDAAGNEEKNTVVRYGVSRRSIVDSDRNVGVNSDKVDPQPDTSLPAMLPSTPGGPKSLAPDLVQTNYLPGVFLYQTNDHPGKVKYSVPIPEAGRYQIAVTWSGYQPYNIYAPGYIYRVTYPDGTTQDFPLDETNALGDRWNVLTTKALTPGTLTIIGDATQITDNTPTNWNVSGAVRALILPPSPATLYRAKAAPTIGSFNAAEWNDVPPFHLNNLAQIIGGAQNWTGPSDYSADLYVKYDDTNLYVGAAVTDDTVSFPDTAPGAIWQKDGLDVYLGLTNPLDPNRSSYDAGDFNVMLSAQDNGNGTFSGMWNSPQSGTMTGVTDNVAVQRTATGYTLEARIPWVELNGAAAPAQGQLIGFDLQANDDDQAVPSQDTIFAVSEQGGGASNPSVWLAANMAGLPPLMGDVDKNGVVNAADASLALKLASGLVSSADSTVSFAAADMDHDGKATILDALAILRKVSGL